MERSDDENNSDMEIIDDLLQPEDLFNDEADEAGDVEQNENQQEEEEEQEDSKTKAKKIPMKGRSVKYQNRALSFRTLDGNNGLSALKKLFKDFKFKGSGHEKEDLVKIMGVLQQWMCYQLCPRYDFESCMQQLEVLGKKKNIQTLIKKFRLGMDEWGESKPDDETPADDDNNMENNENSNKNEFDLLLDEEMANIRSDDDLSQNGEMQTQQNTEMMTEVTLTPEQLERIARNRKLAEERRLKRMKEMEVSQLGEKTQEQEISLERINLDDNS